MKITEMFEIDKEICEAGAGIMGRSHILTAMLLAYCSAIRFVYQGRLLPRGWLDILIIGDTRTGKTTIAEYLVEQTGLGKVLKGENVSFAGLVGGLQLAKNNKRWDLVWGAMPLNKGRILFIDEMSSLSVKDISLMTSIRSSGIAEVIKIRYGHTFAGCRLVWLSNPRDGLSMKHFRYGVEAIVPLIGAMEDIARFDFAIAVRSDDVTIDEINKKVEAAPESLQHKLEALRNLIRFVWTRKYEDFVFASDAEDATVALSRELVSTYKSDIPLVEPNEARIKLARLAVAMASRCYSEEGGKIIIKKPHVELAYDFLNEIYTSKSLGYFDYCNQYKKKQDETEVRRKEALEYLSRFPNTSLQQLMSYTKFTVSDAEVIFNTTRFEAKNIIHYLVAMHIVLRTPDHYYRLTEYGVNLLKELGI